MVTNTNCLQDLAFIHQGMGMYVCTLPVHTSCRAAVVKNAPMCCAAHCCRSGACCRNCMIVQEYAQGRFLHNLHVSADDGANVRVAASLSTAAPVRPAAAIDVGRAAGGVMHMVCEQHACPKPTAATGAGRAPCSVMHLLKLIPIYVKVGETHAQSAAGGRGR